MNNKSERKTAVRDACIWRLGNEKRHWAKGFPGFARCPSGRSNLKTRTWMMTSEWCRQ